MAWRSKKERDEYNKKYYLEHREHLIKRERERYALDSENRRAYARAYHWLHRKHRRDYEAIRSSNPKWRLQKNAGTRRWWRYAKACREDLRSLVEHMPAVAQALGVPDLESATDGQVRQFYDQMMKELKHGDFSKTK